MTITKKDICESIAISCDSSPILVKTIIDAFFAEVLKTLNNDDRLEFRGFGCFQNKIKAARIGRNARTGEIVKIPQRKCHEFKFSKEVFVCTNPQNPGKNK